MTREAAAILIVLNDIFIIGVFMVMLAFIDT